jgi:hypothetical protein
VRLEGQDSVVDRPDQERGDAGSRHALHDVVEAGERKGEYGPKERVVGGGVVLQVEVDLMGFVCALREGR